MADINNLDIGILGAFVKYDLSKMIDIAIPAFSYFWRLCQKTVTSSLIKYYYFHSSREKNCRCYLLFYLHEVNRNALALRWLIDFRLPLYLHIIIICLHRRLLPPLMLWIYLFVIAAAIHHIYWTPIAARWACDNVIGTSATWDAEPMLV